MSTIKSSDEHLTLNADGSSKDIKFQANGVEKGSLSSTGVMTATSFAGSGASLTGLPADATKAPLANPTFTGTVSKSGSSSGTAKIFTTASDASEIYLYIGTGATKFRKQDDSANTFEILPDGRGKSQFTAKAWANWNGTGTPAFRDSHNCSSLTDVSTGNYRVNFSNNMANTNYCPVANGNAENTWAGAGTHANGIEVAYVAIYHVENNTSTDTSINNVLVFGD